MLENLKNLGTPLSKKEQQQVNGAGAKSWWILCRDLCMGTGNAHANFETVCNCN